MRVLNDDTIVALATPSGGAIGILRLSGSEAITMASSLFHPARQGASLANAKAGTLHYGMLKTKGGEDIDDVVVGVYRAPHSYTGEDCVEISCHGSAYILRQALHAFIDIGARQAALGEYTQRAYLNGKMDLSQAEAVADLIASSNKATHKLALSQLKGHFSSALADLRRQLLKMTSLVELELDFSDHEELEFADREELRTLATAIEHHIATLAQSFETASALKEGIPVAIIGKTNVGKSTLLNKLLREERAIVSDVDGTTRDVIEDTMDIQGVTFRFIDTAGLRETDDKVERIGIERAYQKLSEAAIILWVVDDRPTEEETARLLARAAGKKVVVVHNKTDLYPAPSATNATATSTNATSRSPQSRQPIAADAPATLSADTSETSSTTSQTSLTLSRSALDTPLYEAFISAKYNRGIAELEDLIYTTADIPPIDENSVMVTNARHYEALVRAQNSIGRVISGMSLGLSSDLLAEDLHICLEELAEITGGAITTDEVLGNIFMHFCIGK